MTINKLSAYPGFVPFEKTWSARARRVVGLFFGIVAVVALVVLVKGCARDDPYFHANPFVDLGHFIMFVAATIVAGALCFGTGDQSDYYLKILPTVITAHVQGYDAGSSWRIWPLAWDGGWCGISNHALFLFSVKKDRIVTYGVGEIIKISLGHRQTDASTQLMGIGLGGGGIGVGGASAETQITTSWIVDVYVRSDSAPYLPISFGSNETFAKEVYGFLCQHGCLTESGG